MPIRAGMLRGLWWLGDGDGTSRVGIVSIRAPVAKAENALDKWVGKGKVGAEDSCVGFPQVPDSPLIPKGMGKRVVLVEGSSDNGKHSDTEYHA